MLRAVDHIACTNRWRNHSVAVAVLCLGLMLDTLVLPPWPGAVLVLCSSSVLATACARVNIGVYVRALLIPLGFLLVGSFGVLWSVDFRRGWSWYSGSGALVLAFHSALRAWAAASVTLLFAFTVPVSELVRLLQRLRVPRELIELVYLTYRFLFVLSDAQTALFAAQTSRLGYRNVRTSLRSSGQASAALLVRALTQAVRMERGLRCRGYDGELRVLHASPATRPRHVALAVTVAAMVGFASWVMSSRGGA